MIAPDHLGNLTLPERRQLDLLTRERRGCNFADLTLEQARELHNEMLDEVATLNARIRTLTGEDD
ncbi:hypothetical protein ACFYVR_13495 [Rhodococcus sp. NPDC003318]|uniref:hypothetical protein n=1 Tax=Rhodococcus sp. NPDC003318 TaxID=3364503 RepID=UPI0036AC69E0